MSESPCPPHPPAGAAEPAAIAAEVLSVLGTGRSCEPFSSRLRGFDLATAYRAAARVQAARVARGERPVGRKIGFTNRTIWAEYGVWAPIWGWMYDSTVHDLPPADAAHALVGLAEPRIEPEIVFGLARAPAPDMDDAALLDAIDWVAHGFEIVQSVYPRWQFSAADTVAACGLHGALVIGPRHPVAPDRARWLASLAQFEIELCCDGQVLDRGWAANVLDGPLAALRHLVQVLAADASAQALEAGEIVTTGTLTRALPVAAGQTWTTRLHGVPLEGLSLTLG